MRTVVIGIVWLHGAIVAAHAAAHLGAGVIMTWPSMVLIWTVILAGPFAGLVLMRRRPRAGAMLIASTMAVAFVFGVWNHYLHHGNDHVHAIAREWRQSFQWTAGGLAFTEAAGAIAALLAGSARLTLQERRIV